jgi:hypothetical protein
MRPFPDDANVGKALDWTGDGITGLVSILPQDTEVIFFFGDLNFRMKPKELKDWALTHTMSLPRQAPKRTILEELLKEERLDDLMDMDELLHLRKAKAGVLAQFSEAPIKFLPSYKLDYADEKKGHVLPSGVIRSYSKKRLPAYCDRILYFSDHRHSLTSLHYTRILDFDFSDHDPVVGLFHLERLEGSLEKKPVFRSPTPLLIARCIRVLMVNYMLILGVLTLSLLYRCFG